MSSGISKLLEAAVVVGLVDPARAAFQVGRDGSQTPWNEATLVESGLLTPYQMQALKKGDGRSLRIGSYALLDPIGAGGMGAVYRARHLLLNRVVALKLIRTDRRGNANAERLFRDEMRSVAALSHPNIVTAYDAQRDGDRYFLAMEYCPGRSLRQIVHSRGPLPVGLACELMRQAACGLAHAHQAGVVHRDVKPDNLLVVGSTLKILDFGLAWLRRDDLRLDDSHGAAEAAHSVCGTPDFMPPEQAVRPGEIDSRADLYSLGATFYFALTRDLPFPGGTPEEKMLRHRLDPRPSVSSRRHDVPGELSGIVERLMHVDPAQRPDTATEVATALARLELQIEPFDVAAAVDATNEPIDASTPYSTVGAPTLPSARVVQNESPATIGATPSASDGGSSGRRLRRRVGGVVVVLSAALGARFWLNWQTTPSDRTIENQAASHGLVETPEDRAIDDSFLWNLEHTFRPLPNHPLAVAFSPDSKRLAVGCGRWTDSGILGGLRLLEISGDRNALVFAEQRDVTALAFSPDGRTLVAAAWHYRGNPSQGELMFWDLAERSPRQRIATKSCVVSLGFDKSGRRLAVADLDGNAAVWNTAGSTAIPTGALSAGGQVSLAYSPDGAYLASIDRNQTVRFWSVESLELLQTLSLNPLETADTAALAISPAGDRIAAVNSHWPSATPSEIAIWDVKRGSLLRRSRHDRNFASCVFSRDGKRVFTGDAEVLACWPVDAARDVLEVEPPTADWYQAVAVSNDGQWLAAGRSRDDAVPLYRLRQP